MTRGTAKRYWFESRQWTARELSERFTIDLDALKKRLAAAWSVEKAVTTPVKVRPKNGSGYWRQKLACKQCGKAFVGRGDRAYCSAKCRRKRVQVVDTAKAGAASAVAAQLDRAIALETAPPWIRHPVPWTDVRGTARQAQ